jgi:hypothetical protein
MALTAVSDVEFRAPVTFADGDFDTMPVGRFVEAAASLEAGLPGLRSIGGLAAVNFWFAQPRLGFFSRREDFPFLRISNSRFARRGGPVNFGIQEFHCHLLLPYIMCPRMRKAPTAAQ